MLEVKKVGIISCSGEEYAGGGISRLAARAVLESKRPGQTVTICLPLFLAGGEEERHFAQNYPTITIDGCNKRCAMRATEKLSGKVTKALVVSDIVGDDKALEPPFTQRAITNEIQKSVQKMTEVLTEAVDGIIGKPAQDESLMPSTPPSGIRLL